MERDRAPEDIAGHLEDPGVPPALAERTVYGDPAASLPGKSLPVDRP